MMTVHSAKGLEFHVVFISGLEEGLFPHEQSSSEARRPRGGAAPLYVAITRARQPPVPVARADRMLHGQTRYNIPSRFFR